MIANVHHFEFPLNFVVNPHKPAQNPNPIETKKYPTWIYEGTNIKHKTSVIRPTKIPTIGPKNKPVILIIIPVKATLIGGNTVKGTVTEITMVIETDTTIIIET